VDDRAILVGGAFVRAVAIGYLGITLGLHLAAAGLDASSIGAIVASGLAGAATGALAVTLIGDRLSRRTWLVATSSLTAVGATMVALLSTPWAIAAAAFLGMLNGMGRDRGAAPIVDQAALPATVDDAGRTRAFAIYALAQDIGHALGAALAAIPLAGFAIWAYVAASALLVPWYARLSPAVEAGTTPTPPPLSRSTRLTITKISALFAIDAIGGGFLSSAMLTLFFVSRFDASALAIAALFAASRILNALSHLGAAWLARRIGLVNTMVFTHLPSSLLLITVPFAPNFPIAALLFLLREGLVEMDVPTRQSYVMAVVSPSERTRAAGITQLVRLAGWALGPLIAGLWMSRDALIAPVIAGASLKIAYDLLLYRAFRSVRPPEER
jgi:MFS family permease